jgi:RND family efflux transporter MFP subunit
MKVIFTILICLGLLGGAVFAVKTLAIFKPEAQKIEKERIVPSVEVIEARPVNVSLQIPTQGLIEASRITSLASEVAGKVTFVDPRFEVGGRFARDEVMIRLDDADYQSALVQARSAEADARAALAQERARAEQAIRDWKKLSPGSQPSDLAARKPQLASAEARLEAATDGVAKAERDLARTQVRTPFNARIKTTRTEIGSYLAPGSPVAEIDSTGAYEVRLPLGLDDYAFIKADSSGDPASVSLTASAGGREWKWEGKVIRVEGEVDRASRSVRIVAAVEGESGGGLLQPGLFVKASVQGQTLENVYRIPRSAFVDEDSVLIVKDDNRISFRDLQVLRPDGTDLLVGAGLQPGDQVCLTTLAAPIEDMEVQVLAPGPTAASAP